MRSLRALFLAIAMTAVASVASAAGRPIVRVALTPAGPVVVGQQLTVTVQVLVPNYFLSAPDWPTLDVDGAVVTMPDEVMPHLTETIGSDSYAGVQKKYVITPQQEGDFALPAVQLRFKFAAVPGQPPSEGVVTLPQSRFSARWPAGAHTDDGVLPVTRLAVRQTLDRKPAGLTAGDALTRTITTVAARTQPMMILPPAIVAPDGVRIYRKDPVLSTDLGVHGELNAGRRVDRVTYLFERPGHYTLPAMEFPWFDAATSTREVARAPEIVVDVAPAAAAVPAIAPESAPVAPSPAPPSPWLIWKQRLPWIAGGLAALLMVFWLLRRVWPRYRTWRFARRDTRQHSERAYFERFERACRAGDPSAVYAALAGWAWRAGHGSIAAWCATLGNEAFSKEVAALERTLFSSRTADPWSGSAMREAARRARASWLEVDARRRRQRSFLPALNP